MGTRDDLEFARVAAWKAFINQVARIHYDRFGEYPPDAFTAEAGEEALKALRAAVGPPLVGADGEELG
jgi:hypothetical protein